MKIFNDVLYGSIELSDTAVKIIDTPEYQRLRFIKQLGSCQFIYYTANHTRFEHSLGVAHLGKELLRRLKDRQPELVITKDDILCVELAGLCHDLGHGPFSHLFEKIVLNEHEKRSCQLFEYIIRKYNINLTNEQIIKVQEMIHPTQTHESFIYNIVSNADNGIDVDKFDYIQRDIYYTGIKLGFDGSRIFAKSRVINNKLCFPVKDIFNIKQLFNTRSIMHERVYNYLKGKAVDAMLLDIFKIGEKYYHFDGISKDMEQFGGLNDSIIYDIIGKDQEAKKIFNRILTRDFYKLIKEYTISKDEISKIEQIKSANKYSHFFMYHIVRDQNLNNIFFDKNYKLTNDFDTLVNNNQTEYYKIRLF